MMHDTTTSISMLRGPVQFSHLLLESLVRPGSRAVDATCGKGHDTLLLARLVGTAGTVWSFDIQEQAVRETRQKLEDAGMEQRVNLVHNGHEHLAEYVHAPIDAAVFNLGYLPGGDRSVITRPETTLHALGQALHLLSPGGLLVIAIYPGHPGGPEEEHAVEAWAGGLVQKAYHVWRLGQINTQHNAPYLILIQKAA